MQLDLASDLDILYADFGVLVVHTPQGGVASAPALALFDQPGTEILGGQLLATDYALRFPAAAFPNVRRGALFTIAGGSYKARESAQPTTIDGLEHIVPLERVA
jgi:hypothetical protein